ncbi:MAG: hypothetical protein WBE46_00695 [Dehalococcoidia bacterium]
MWSDRAIEKITERELKQQLGLETGEERFALYIAARRALVGDILPNIARMLPAHTDHGSEHVGSVLENAALLLGLEDIDAEEYPTDLSGLELYCLILSILFHDVGNIFGREDHQRRVAEIYDLIRAPVQKQGQERKILLQITSAHCGDASDGSRDTLKELMGPAQLDRKPIRIREVAAILRFADELDEGPQRTSLVMQQYHQYPPQSEVFHRYSDITNVYIDRGNNRIALTYDLNIDTNGSKQLSADNEAKLRNLLKFTYIRIRKLNQERKYARHYCTMLDPFKETTVVFDFLVDKRPHNFGFPRVVSLTDLVVPGDIEKEFYEYCGDFAIDNVIEKIRSGLQSV